MKGLDRFPVTTDPTLVIEIHIITLTLGIVRAMEGDGPTGAWFNRIKQGR